MMTVCNYDDDCLLVMKTRPDGLMLMEISCRIYDWITTCMWSFDSCESCRPFGRFVFVFVSVSQSLHVIRSDWFICHSPNSVIAYSRRGLSLHGRLQVIISVRLNYRYLPHTTRGFGQTRHFRHEPTKTKPQKLNLFSPEIRNPPEIHPKCTQIRSW